MGRWPLPTGRLLCPLPRYRVYPVIVWVRAGARVVLRVPSTVNAVVSSPRWMVVVRLQIEKERTRKG